MVTEGQDVQCTSYIRSVKCRLGFGNDTSIKWREKLKSLPATIQKSFRQYQLPCSHFKTISQPDGFSLSEFQKLLKDVTCYLSIK